MARITLQQIKEDLLPLGWQVLSDKYTNLDTLMHFQCANGHDIYMPWKKLRGKIECPTCRVRRPVKDAQEQVVPKPKNTRRCLALDQATKTTGFAIFDNKKLIKYGSFTTIQDDEVQRFLSIKSWLISMIESWKPDFIGLEGIQFQDEGGAKMGVTVFQALARLQGALMVVCEELGVPYEIYPTNTWRHTCGVKGRARSNRKKSMQLLTKQWYDISVTEDEADAIGIGTHMVKFVEQNTVISDWES